MINWFFFLAIIAITALSTVNYEVGYQNGKRDCYGCGIWFDEPVLYRLWDPWFVEEDDDS